jgi:uncharacterized protein YjbI with pentapeptide repeats
LGIEGPISALPAESQKQKADLTGCIFNECKLTGCEFEEAVIKETSFYKSDLRGATLGNMNVSEAGFRLAKLDLEQCVYIAERMTDGKYTPDNGSRNGNG